MAAFNALKTLGLASLWILDAGLKFLRGIKKRGDSLGGQLWRFAVRDDQHTFTEISELTPLARKKCSEYSAFRAGHICNDLSF